MPGPGATLASALTLIVTPPSMPPRASVVVEAPELVAEEPALPSILEDELGAVLWELGVGPRRLASDPVLAVLVEPEPDGYRYEIAGVVQNTCTPCRREELSAALAGAVEGYATQVWGARRGESVVRTEPPPPPPASAAVTTLEPAPSVVPSPSEVRPAPAEPRGEEPQVLGLRRAGIAMFVIYGASAVAGVTLIGIDRVRSSDDASESYEGLEYQGVGFALLGLSVASLVVGGVMLGMSANRRRSTVARIRVAPTRSGFRF